MNRRFQLGLASRLLLFFVCVLVLGLAPRPHAFDQALRQATRSLAAGSPLRASQAVAQAARLAPWRADLWEQAGLYAFQAGETQPAIEYLERASDSASLSQQSLTALGQAYHQAGDLSAALRFLQQSIDRYGPSQQALDYLSQIHLEQGDYTAVIADLKSLIELQPQDARLLYHLGLLLAAQDPPAAQSFLDRAAQLDPAYQPVADAVRRAVLSARLAEDPAYTLLVTGRALAALGEWSLASQAFHQATTLRPDYAEAWAYLGEARQHPEQGTLLLNRAGSSDGLADLQKAIQLDPASLAANTFLSLYYARRGSIDLALAPLRQAIVHNPDNLALQVQLAGLLAASGDLYQAKDTYLSILQRAPQDTAYVRALIQFCLDYDFEIKQTALPLARRLAADYPRDPANLDTMAQVLIKQGDLASANRFLYRALALQPDYTPALLHLGQANLLQGDRSSALQRLRQVVLLAPGSPEAAQAQRLMDDYLH